MKINSTREIIIIQIHTHYIYYIHYETEKKMVLQRRHKITLKAKKLTTSSSCHRSIPHILCVSVCACVCMSATAKVNRQLNNRRVHFVSSDFCPFRKIPIFHSTFRRLRNFQSFYELKTSEKPKRKEDGKK